MNDSLSQVNQSLHPEEIDKFLNSLNNEEVEDILH